jgi:alpha-amylase
MSTKFFSDGAVHAYFNPYENPYQAFMNYMNVLSDFEIRLNIVCPVNDHDAEINRLSESIQTKDHLISELQEKLTKYERKGRVTRAKAVKAKKVTSATAAVKKAVTVKVPAKKAAPVKAAPVKAAPKRAVPKKATAKKTSTKSVTAKKATK